MKSSFEKYTLELGLLETNCYLLIDKLTRKAAVIDPADQYEMIVNALKKHNAELESILLTHGHYDHIGAVPDLIKAFSVPVYIHQADSLMLQEPEKNFSRFVGADFSFKGKLHFLKQDQQLQIGGSMLRVIHTPGHTPGSVCFLADTFLVSGDTLFFMGIGRTDLPGGSERDILQSISEKILSLQDDLPVFPGHGPSTTISREKKSNPHFQ